MRGRVLTALSAVALASIATAVLGESLGLLSLPLVLSWASAPLLGGLYFLLPGVACPLLVAWFPLAPRSPLRVAVLTTLSLLFSAAYLVTSDPDPGNQALEPAIALLLLVACALSAVAILANRLGHRRFTLVYHLLFITWLFTAAFPYLGDYP